MQTEREREREREREIAPSSLRSSRLDRRPHPLHVTVRSRHEPTNRSTHLVHRRDHATNPRTDRRPRPLHVTVRSPRTHEPIDPPRPLARSRHEPMNRSTHPSSSPTNPRTDCATIGLVILIFFVLIFVSCVVYMLQLSVIIFVWILKKCEKHDKNGFSRAFSAKQPNTRKYFPKYFLECNQTLENIFLSRKYFQIFT